jgi:hypothetical protein
MILGRREWDIQTLKTCFLHHDVEEVRKIRLSDRAEDMLVWHYEKTGIFSLRSAYKLPQAKKRETGGQQHEPKWRATTL